MGETISFINNQESDVVHNISIKHIFIDMFGMITTVSFKGVVFIEGICFDFRSILKKIDINDFKDLKIYNRSSYVSQVTDINDKIDSIFIQLNDCMNIVIIKENLIKIQGTVHVYENHTLEEIKKQLLLHLITPLMIKIGYNMEYIKISFKTFIRNND